MKVGKRCSNCCQVEAVPGSNLCAKCKELYALRHRVGPVFADSIAARIQTLSNLRQGEATMAEQGKASGLRLYRVDEINGQGCRLGNSDLKQEVLAVMVGQGCEIQDGHLVATHLPETKVLSEINAVIRISDIGPAPALA